MGTYIMTMTHYVINKVNHIQQHLMGIGEYFRKESKIVKFANCQLLELYTLKWPMVFEKVESGL